MNNRDAHENQSKNENVVFRILTDLITKLM